MIFMAVREDDGAHFVTILLEVSDVRDDDVHAEQLSLGKHHSRVNHQNILAAAEDEHVHPEFAEAAEGDCPERGFAQNSDLLGVYRSTRVLAVPLACDVLLRYCSGSKNMAELCKHFALPLA